MHYGVVMFAVNCIKRSNAEEERTFLLPGHGLDAPDHSHAGKLRLFSCHLGPISVSLLVQKEGPVVTK
jgi:hypothetical protein